MNQPVLSTAKWVALLGCLVATFYVGVAPIIYNDFWLQAKVGELVWQELSIPTTLLFPYTEIAGETFNAHEWLASLFFHLSLLLFGEHGMPVLLGLMSSLLFASAALLAYRRNGGRVANALACGLVAVWAENYRHWMRPELVALLLMLSFWIAADDFLRSGRRWALAAAALLTVLWANCHGSFILAPIIAGLYAAVPVWRELRTHSPRPLMRRLLHAPAVHLLALVSLATLINPFGIEMHAFVLHFSSASYIRETVPEWKSLLDGMQANERGFYIGMLVWAAMLLRLLWQGWRGQWQLIECLFFVAFTLLGFYSIRFLVYFGLVAAFVFSTPRTQPSSAERANWMVLGAALATLALALAFGNAYRATPLVPPPNVKFTPGLVDALADPRLNGNVLNSVELGAELVYRAYPRLRPSVDSRIDSYGLDYLLYQRALLDDDALLNEYAARYDVRYVLLDSVRFEVFSRLQSWQRGDWKVLYQSSKEVLLVRKDLT